MTYLNIRSRLELDLDLNEWCIKGIVWIWFDVMCIKPSSYVTWGSIWMHENRKHNNIHWQQQLYEVRECSTSFWSSPLFAVLHLGYRPKYAAPQRRPEYYIILKMESTMLKDSKITYISFVFERQMITGILGIFGFLKNRISSSIITHNKLQRTHC